MKKTTVLWAILDLIFLVIFNVCFFLIGEASHPMSVWISYGFIHLAYFLLLATPFLTRKGKSAALFGATLGSISTVYFFVEFLVGLIFILVGAENYKAALIVQLIIAGIYAIILISNMIANEHTADAEVKHQQEVSYIKSATSEVSALLNRVDDKATKKKVERVFDELNSSPTKSHPEIASLESNILTALNRLKNAVSDGNKDEIAQTADALFAAVSERNRKLKTLN